jgi:hypothetical protein
MASDRLPEPDKISSIDKGPLLSDSRTPTPKRLVKSFADDMVAGRAEIWPFPSSMSSVEDA